MKDSSEINAGLQQETDYYKSQLNALTGSVINLEYKIAEMGNEISQMKKGLELIADLHHFDNTSTVEDIYDHFTEQINVKMQMDRSLVLKPAEGNPHYFNPSHLKGYSSKDIHSIENETICLPPAFLEEKKSLLFNSLSPPDPFTDSLSSKLMTRYFILTPVIVQGEIISFLFAGRKVEARMLAASRLLTEDVHTLEALAGVIAAIRNQYEKFCLLDAERTRIAREMHDDIGAELTKIKMFSQLLNAQGQVGENEKQKLQKISDSASHVLQSIGEIIWTMNSKNDNLENLAAYIRRYASEYLETNGVGCSIDFPRDLPSLFIQNQSRGNIFLTVKEALHNIVKHANAKNVTIGMTYEGSTMYMKITDDGKGMEHAHSAGNGLTNMRYRIEQSGGSFELLSEKNKGTTVSFRIKLYDIGS